MTEAMADGIKSLCSLAQTTEGLSGRLRTSLHFTITSVAVREHSLNLNMVPLIQVLILLLFLLATHI